MIITVNNLSHSKGIDCRNEFKLAYQNRYTWPSEFKGYKGKCDHSLSGNIYTTSFSIGKDYKPSVKGIEDKNIIKSIESQLFEFSIHRIKRSFSEVHGNKIFKFGDKNKVGIKILFEGVKSNDHYRIKEHVITKVHRTIHNKIVVIYTTSILNTELGYFAHEYTSEYKDPLNGNSLGILNTYKDDFEKISNSDNWVLSKRQIVKQFLHNQLTDIETYRFYDLENL